MHLSITFRILVEQQNQLHCRCCFCWSCLCRRGRRSLLPIFSVESLNASCGIDQLLLAREERVAGGANFHVQVSSSRAGLEGIAADAGDDCFLVIRMYTGLHRSLHCSFSNAY